MNSNKPGTDRARARYVTMMDKPALTHEYKRPGHPGWVPCTLERARYVARLGWTVRRR